VACSPENRVSLCGDVELHIATPLQRRRSSLKRKELREYILVSLASPLQLSCAFTYIAFTLVVCLLVTYREIHLVARLENLPLCQA
jgi:hypothetical protein